MSKPKPRRERKLALKEQRRERLWAMRAELALLYDGRPPERLMKLCHYQTQQALDNYHQARRLYAP